MRIYYAEDSLPVPASPGFFEGIAGAAARLEGLNSSLGITLTFTDDEGIRSINKAWRQVDAATDVLSFPAADFCPGDTAGSRGVLPPDSWDSEQGAYFLGDIVISLPRIRAQAEAYGHSFERELAYLFAHGVLHLMGYDHQSPEDKKQMREKEEQVLSAAFRDPGADQALIQQALTARDNAYTPYSNYKVGAAVRTKGGKVYTGCNIENVSFGLTNCAERTAIFKAVSEGETEFDAIAIAAGATAPWPCGACRQVLSEFAPRMRVLLVWDEGRKTAQSTLDQLLPHSFLSFEEDHKKA